jgi:hypothetical protein
MRAVKVLSMIVCGCALLAIAASEAGEAQTAAARRDRDAVLALSATVDLGKDLGQNFGSLFEVKDAAGRVIAGAGFVAAFNTRFRMDRHTLQFFVRPADGEDRFTLKRLPRPDDDCGLYMFDFDGKLYAINDSTGRFFREWDPSAPGWRRASGPVDGLTSSSDGVMRLGRGMLRFVGGRVEYDGKTSVRSTPAGATSSPSPLSGR